MGLRESDGGNLFTSDGAKVRSIAQEAVSEEKKIDCLRAGEAVMNLLHLDIKPRDIMTEKAFHNAMVMVMVLGGSTNAVLHLIAMAKSVGITLTLKDFQNISDSTPVIADLKPITSMDFKKIFPLFSYLFHPLFISVYAALFYFFVTRNYFYPHEIYLILFQVVILTLFLPVSTYFLLKSLCRA